MVNALEYFKEVSMRASKVARDELPNVKIAAAMIVDCIMHEGIIQAFGTGHSEAIAGEIARRAGGLVPTNKICLRDIVLFGGESATTLFEGPIKLERNPAISQRLYDLAAPGQKDVFVLISNSGINGAVVEMALIAKAQGHKIITILSKEHAHSEESRHPSKARLSELSDVVLDNGAPIGDAILSMANDETVCAVSTITGALLAQMMVAEAIGIMEEKGATPPIWLSANVASGDQHNSRMDLKYAGRIRRTA